MASVELKSAQAATAAPRRPALRARAASVSATPSGPSTSVSPSSELEDRAAYAIGYQAGLIDGERRGAERERARWNTDESINERIERLMSLEVRPRALRALDHVVSWLLYAIGISGIVAGAVIIWRLAKWI